MAWTYSPENLATSKRDQIRFSLGDTNEDTALLQDEEIDFILLQAGDDVPTASLAACSAIIGILSSAVSFRVGPYSEDQSDRRKAYEVLYRRMRLELIRANPPIMLNPTTSAIFRYDMMSLEDPHHE